MFTKAGVPSLRNTGGQVQKKKEKEKKLKLKRKVQNEFPYFQKVTAKGACIGKSNRFKNRTKGLQTIEEKTKTITFNNVLCTF